MAMCRLCLRTDKLESVFDLNSSGNVADVIKITCGVEIKTTDRISQMICDTCHKIALKMFKFRSISIKNNETLLAEFNSKSSSSSEPKGQPTKTIPVPIKSPKPQNLDLLQKPMHSSIRKILQTYPNITLPRQIRLDHHFGPCITLLTTETSHWQVKRKRPLIEPTTSVQNKKVKVLEAKPECPSPKTVKEDPKPQKRPIPTLQELLRSIGKEKKAKTEKKEQKKINVIESIVLGVPKPSQKNIADNGVGTSVNLKKNFENSVGPKNILEKILMKENIVENSETKENIAENIVIKENNLDNNVCQDNINSAPEIISTAQKPPIQFDSSQVTTIMSPRKVDITPIIDDDQSSASSDRLQIDLDHSNDNISREKSDFVKSLALVPASDPALVPKCSSSLDESLLLSHINKSQTLLSCQICNTWYCTTKQLKIHQKKVHTKCPFCGKKFRSLETKTEHDLYQCGKTRAQQSDIRLVLERVDENKEIVEKYSQAFSNNIESDVDVDVEGDDGPQTNNQVDEVVESENSPVHADETVDMGNEANIDLTNGNDKDQTPKPKTTDKRRTSYVDNGLKLTLKQTDGRYVIVNDDCIYVSDDDEDSASNTPPVKRTINLHNNPILKKSSNDDNVSLLQKLLTEISTKENNNSVPHSFKFKIKNTTTNKCKLLKDHGELLKKGNIPVELSYGRDLVVGHKCVHSNLNFEPKHLWYNLPTVGLNKTAGKVVATIRELRPKTGESSKVILNSTSTTSATAITTTATIKVQNNSNPVRPTVPPFDPTSITPGTSSYINYRIKTAAQGCATVVPPKPPKPQPSTTSSGYINLTINNTANIAATSPAPQVYTFNPSLKNTSTPIRQTPRYILPTQSVATVTNESNAPPLQPIASSTIPRILLTAPNTTSTLPVTVRNFLLLPSTSQCVPLDNGTEVVQNPSTSSAPVPPPMQSTIRVKNIIELS